MATLAECITESFYAWEIRGRGWGLADYPVALEPPYRPFLLLPGVITSPSVLDDGRRPTVLSALVEGAKRFFGNESKVVPQSEPLGPYVEREPFRAPDPVSYVPLRVLVPPEYRTDHNATEELLAALATARYPVSVELVGAAGRVGMQIVCAEDDVAHVQSLVEGYIPEASVTPDSDLLSQAWDCDAMRLAVDVGLTEEFFLPIQPLDAFAIDPYVVLVAALARAGRGEFLTLQVLFERVRNPWAWAITDALDDGDGGCIVEDAPEFLRGAEEKVKNPLFAVSCRVGAQADSDARVLALAREMEAFLRQYTRAGGNAVTPL